VKDVERYRKLPLRAAFAFQALDIVENQRVEAVQFPAKKVELSLAGGAYVIAAELGRGRETYRAVRVALAKADGQSAQEVRLAGGG